MRHILSGAAGVVLALASAPAVRASDDTGQFPTAREASTSAATGGFLALTHSATLEGPAAHGFASGGYDSARGASMFEAVAEARIWGPLAVRGGVVYTGDARLRPSAGARVQALRERRHGLDGTLGVFYRPEGLTEPEGEIEAVVALGGHLGGSYLAGNLVYGQDPEGRERDGEVRLSVVAPALSRLHLGLDGRVRFDLGSAARGPDDATLDALAGPAAAVSLGPIALLLQGGGSALRLDTRTRYGAFVMGGAGTIF
jgi:hypothetical protein